MTKYSQPDRYGILNTLTNAGHLAAAFVTAGLLLSSCTNDVAEPLPAPGAHQDETIPIEITVPDVLGEDLRRAVRALEKEGLKVDLSALPKTTRRYATRYQTHPRVQVSEIDPLPGAEVKSGSTIAIVSAECPRKKPC